MERRDFILSAVGAAGLIAARLPLATAVSAPLVTLVRDPGWIKQGAVDSARIGALLDKLLCEHFNTADPVEILRTIFSPQDRVGLKVNCLSGRRMSTHAELVEAVVQRLLQAGVPPKNILIWDRMNQDLQKGGFILNDWGKPVACAGCDVLGYDSELTLHRLIGAFRQIGHRVLHSADQPAGAEGSRHRGGDFGNEEFLRRHP